MVAAATVEKYANSQMGSASRFEAGRLFEMQRQSAREAKQAFSKQVSVLEKEEESLMARELIGPPIRAAGGVLWRSAGEKNGGPLIEVAVIHRPRYDDWSLPKGKLAPGESEVEGAIREVFEETGHRVRLGQPLGKACYTKTSGNAVRPKVVRYWSMEAEAGVFVPGREVDDLRWVSLAEAADMLTHPRDRELLDRFVRGPSLGAASCSYVTRAPESVPNGRATIAFGPSMPLGGRRRKSSSGFYLISRWETSCPRTSSVACRRSSL